MSGDRLTGPFRAALILIAIACVAGTTSLPAQQASDSARASITNAAPASAPSIMPAPGPRVSPSQFQSYTPRLGRNASEHSAAAAAGAGQQTIVISTLALVLIIIIVVLLVR